MPRSFDDAHLWDAYQRAREEGDEPAERRALDAIVNFHYGFILTYANKYAFKTWSKSTFDDYVQDLFLVMIERIPGYDPTNAATFPTYLRPYLQPVFWKVRGEGPITVGRETSRIRAAAEQSNAWKENPGNVTQELVDAVSTKEGKAFTRSRVEGAIRLSVKPIDKFSQNTYLPAIPDIADEIADRSESEWKSTAVRRRLNELDLTDLEWDLVRVLEGPDYKGDRVPTPLDLAIKYGVSEKYVKDVKRLLVALLREAL